MAVCHRHANIRPPPLLVLWPLLPPLLRMRAALPRGLGREKLALQFIFPDAHLSQSFSQRLEGDLAGNAFCGIDFVVALLSSCRVLGKAPNFQPYAEGVPLGAIHPPWFRERLGFEARAQRGKPTGSAMDPALASPGARSSSDDQLLDSCIVGIIERQLGAG